MKKHIFKKLIFAVILIIVTTSCSTYVTISGKSSIIMEKEAEKSEYLEEITMNLSGQSANRGFILEFNPPRLRDSVINEFDTLKTIKLEVPRKFIKESIPSDVFLRASTAKRIK